MPSHLHNIVIGIKERLDRAQIDSCISLSLPYNVFILKILSHISDPSKS